MKNITSDYKTNVKNFGRQIDSKISYTIEGTTTELGKEQLNSVTPHYESSILKSAMKQLDIDSNVDIPLNTTLNYQFGVLVNNDYEYINYGNYVVYSSEKQEDTNSYRIICYDKMLYSMIDYTKMNITYPITIRNYIQAICDTIGLNFKNANDEFANYDKEIQNELYFDADGKSLGYKFRDVLDELAQVTGSTICISEDDELEIRYTNDLINEEKEVEGNPITIQDNEGETPLEIDLKGNTTQQTYTGKNLIPSEISSQTTSGLTVTKYSDGSFLLNGTTTATISRLWLFENKNIPLSAGTYTLSTNSTGTVNDTVYFVLRNTSNVEMPFTVNLKTQKYKTATLNNSANILQGYLYIGTGITFTNYKIYPMFTQENSMTSYEQYVGGTPSPNPSYPQPINNVTGRQEIDVVGKNLFDGEVELGSFDASGNTTNNNDCVRTKNFTRIQPNTHYVISNDMTYQNVCFIYDSNYNFIRGIGNVSNITTQSNDCYIKWRSSVVNIENNLNVKWQLEEGNQATTYEPYIGKQYEINLGKNLFDISKDNIGFSTSSTISATDNGLKITCTTSGIYRWYAIPLSNTNKLLGKTITISTDMDVSNNQNGQVALYFINKNNYSLGTAIGSSGSKPSGKITFTVTIPNTLPSNSTHIGLLLYSGINQTSVNYYVDYNNIQIEYGNQSTSYSPYKEPIELCKIGDYQDYIRKSTGKNLFDVNNMTLNEYLDGEGNPGTSIYWDITNYIEVKPNTKYTYRGLTQVGSNAVQSVYYNKNKEKISTFKQATGTNTITTPDNCYYIRFSITKNLVNDKYVFMIEKGTQATTYEPYGKVWYLHKETGKVVLNGSETWNYNTNLGWWTNENATLIKNSSVALSNKYTYTSSTWQGNYTFSINAAGYIAISDNTYSTLANWQNYLSSNNVEVIYQLETPTNTEITDTELINQLERIKLLNGLNQISLSSDGTLKLKYINEYETIDEYYLKDVNVTFGEKYGPVNSIVLSRNAGADNVYLRDEDSIAEDGLCEIKISDNQIMNFNDRDTYLPDLLKTLKGYSYYLNDFSSTGITFYELCDKYRVKIGDTKYPCIMYNDEVLVTQGLQENVHTDRPEESETDYSKADKTDRRINQTNLIVNKQTGDIEALTTKTEEIEEDLSENYYTKSMTNQLIQNAETGVTNTFSEAGGNNILRNTNFAAKEVLETGQEYEYWYGNVVKATNTNSANGMSILLQNGNLYQEQQVANGTYTVSFYYKKLNPLATGKLVVNGIEYALTEDDYTLFQTGLKDEVGAYITQPVVVNDNYLKVQFTSDTNNAIEVYDIMCNFGTVKLAYSQNQNETITNTVNISKGITITASDKDVKFVATPDGIRIKNKDTDEIITDFTDKGMDTKNAIIEETATIVGIYRQKVGDQVWDSLM